MNTNPTSEWKTVLVEPERLHCGLWSYQEGDISASYSGDTYGEKKQVRQPFKYKHIPHVAMSSQTSGFSTQQMRAYPLIHGSYLDSIMEDYRNKGIRDGYVGKAIKWHGNDCVFGLPIIFKQRELSKTEIVDLCRRMYAYGGMFAAEAGSYNNLIATWAQKYTSARLQNIFAKEINADLPQSREAMRELIQIDAAAPTTEQLNLL